MKRRAGTVTATSTPENELGRVLWILQTQEILHNIVHALEGSWELLVLEGRARSSTAASLAAILVTSALVTFLAS